MEIGIVVIIFGFMFIIAVGALITSIVTFIKLREYEAIIAELSNDSGKLKKVSVGNYLDVMRIKKRIGMDTDANETGDTEN